MARLRAGDITERGQILRPTKSPADGGREGQPEVIEESWGFKKEQSTGREMNVARQMTPLVTHVLLGWATGKEIRNNDYVLWNDANCGVTRRLNIEFADVERGGGPLVLKLVCIEQAK